MPDKKNDTQKRERNSKGQFTKGHKKAGGRKLGTGNRSGNVRDRLKEQVEPFVDNINEYLMKVKTEEGTKEMLYLVEKFMPYFMPKYSAVALSADMDRPISEEQRLVELNDMYTKKELSINYKQMTVVDNNAAKVAGDNDPDYDPNFDVEAFLKKRATE
jgi:hypothetical protein